MTISEAAELRIAKRYPDDAFSRLDESDDAEFYSQERHGPHLDARALSTVERIINTLVVGSSVKILDLMAGLDSHIPPSVDAGEVVGLGLSGNELTRNERLTRHVLHDLNSDPRLPFEDESFDVVLNTVSVDYLTQPFEVFTEVARVLKPGGLFVVIFSNRMFRTKAVKIWLESNDTERQTFVEDLFASVRELGETTVFTSRGKTRPKDDKYAGLGLPSDPITAVFAEKTEDRVARLERPRIAPEPDDMPPKHIVLQRKARIRQTLECPYCESKLEKWAVPESPFNEWPNEYMYICFNNDCPYLITGWDVMTGQGSPGFSYRLMYNPDQNRCQPVPITSPRAEREHLISPHA